jgi:DhnA family fructose-bisphosphate aldolase class Ia
MLPTDHAYENGEGVMNQKIAKEFILPIDHAYENGEGVMNQKIAKEFILPTDHAYENGEGVMNQKIAKRKRGMGERCIMQMRCRRLSSNLMI